jgi:uncharacterized protein YqeY
MSLKETIISDLTGAMKAQDAARVSTLRMVKANLMNRQIDKGGELTDEEVIKALQSLVKQRRDSIEQYEKAGRAELAEKEAIEISHIEAYLPQAASPEEIEQAVADAVAETGASSMKEMGSVMKAALAKLQGKSADGKVVSEAVKQDSVDELLWQVGTNEQQNVAAGVRWSANSNTRKRKLHRIRAIRTTLRPLTSCGLRYSVNGCRNICRSMTARVSSRSGVDRTG